MAEVAKKTKSKRCTKNCVAFGCSNVANLDSRTAGITFHAFPISKPELVKKWERAMHRKDFKATRHSRVCSVHFSPESFDRTGCTVRIRAGAVPSIFDLLGHPKHLKCHTEACCPDWNGAVASLSTVKTGNTVTSTVKMANAVASTVNMTNAVASTVKMANAVASAVTTTSTVAVTVGTTAALASTALTVTSCNTSSAAVTNSSPDPLYACVPRGNDNGTSVASQASGSTFLPCSTIAISQSTKLPTFGAEHSYSLPSSTELKHQLEVARVSLAGCRTRLKSSQQKNRRLGSRLRSLQRLVFNLIENELISQEAADFIKSKFHFSLDHM